MQQHVKLIHIVQGLAVGLDKWEKINTALLTNLLTKYYIWECPWNFATSASVWVPESKRSAYSFDSNQQGYCWRPFFFSSYNILSLLRFCPQAFTSKTFLCSCHKHTTSIHKDLHLTGHNCTAIWYWLSITVEVSKSSLSPVQVLKVQVTELDLVDT